MFFQFFHLLKDWHFILPFDVDAEATTTAGRIFESLVFEVIARLMFISIEKNTTIRSDERCTGSLSRHTYSFDRISELNHTQAFLFSKVEDKL